MSYILDALRKADAQRQRERPGLHAHPAASSPSDEPARWSRSPALWGALGLGLVVVAIVAWWPRASTPSAPVAEPAPKPVEVVQAPAVPAPVAPAPPVAVVPAVPPAAANAIEPPPPARVVPPPAPAPARLPAAPTGREPATAAAPPVPASAPARVASAAAPAEGPAPADAPKLAITGGVYSSDPTQRMLIVGGQVFNEGSQVAPGVVLEQVRPHQAVLSFRGQRYTVGY